MPVFLHAADVHLDSPMQGLERYEGAPVERLRDATRRALEGLVSLALAREVAFVVIAGDLYDGDWRDYRTGLFFNAQMVRLLDARIPVFVGKGNHDAASEITLALTSPGNVSLFPTAKPETFIREDLGVALHGRSYPQRRVDEDLTPSYPAALPGLLNIGVLHTCLDGREGHEAYAPCSLDGLRRRGYGYWALGHVHTAEIVAREPWIVFPGNTQGRTARETGPKGVGLVSYEGIEVTGYEPAAVDVVRWAHARVEASAARDGEEALELVRRQLTDMARHAEGRLLAVRVDVEGASAAHGMLHANPARFTNEIRSLANELGDVWVEKVRFLTRPHTDRDALRRREDAIGDLVRALDGAEECDADLARFAGELDELRAKLPHDVLGAPELPAVGDLAGWRALVREAKETLLGRLVEGGDV